MRTVVGGAVGRRSARRQMEGMQAAQAQEQAARSEQQATQQAQAEAGEFKRAEHKP